MTHEQPTAEPLRRVTAEVAHRIDSRTLLGLLPNLDQRYLTEVRQEFARFLHYPPPRTPREALTTWQDAWNAWTEATPHRSGLITIRTPRCPDNCRGGVSHRNISRNISRTGNPHICGTCRGTGRGTNLRQPARYATPPAPAANADQESS